MCILKLGKQSLREGKGFAQGCSAHAWHSLIHMSGLAKGLPLSTVGGSSSEPRCSPRRGRSQTHGGWDVCSEVRPQPTAQFAGMGTAYLCWREGLGRTLSGVGIGPQACGVWLRVAGPRQMLSQWESWNP